MIHERDYSITLEQQIENIRKTIDVNCKDDYPIDIMDGINQIYLERYDGYWERYEYDADGKIKSYVDSTDPEHPTVIGAAKLRRPILDTDELFSSFKLHESTMEEKMETIRGVLAKEGKIGILYNPTLGDGGTKHLGYLPHHIYNHLYPDGIDIAELRQSNPAVKMKMITKVFMVELNDILDGNTVDYTTCDNITFMAEANRQSKGGIRIFTLAQFQESCNSCKTSIVSAIIRFIEMANVVANDVSGSM